SSVPVSNRLLLAVPAFSGHRVDVPRGLRSGGNQDAAGSGQSRTQRDPPDVYLLFHAHFREPGSGATADDRQDLSIRRACAGTGISLVCLPAGTNQASHNFARLQTFCPPAFASQRDLFAAALCPDDAECGASIIYGNCFTRNGFFST